MLGPHHQFLKLCYEKRGKRRSQYLWAGRDTPYVLRKKKKDNITISLFCSAWPIDPQMQSNSVSSKNKKQNKIKTNRCTHKKQKHGENKTTINVTFRSREKGNDHQLKRLLIVKQILLVSTLGNVKRTVWRIYALMLGCKGLT